MHYAIWLSSLSPDHQSQLIGVAEKRMGGKDPDSEPKTTNLSTGYLPFKDVFVPFLIKIVKGYGDPIDEISLRIDRAEIGFHRKVMRR